MSCFEMQMSSAAMYHFHKMKMTTMSIYEGNDKTISTDTEACSEVVASQEEIYLEVEEEDLRAILVFDESTCICDRKMRGT